MRIAFFVPGVPRPQGSKTAFYIKTIKRVVQMDACKDLKPWRATVAAFAREAYQGPIITGPVSMIVDFVFARPVNHYGSGKNAARLKESAPVRMSNGYDLDKLQRSIGDALTGIVYRDDKQIDEWHAQKIYGDKTGVTITVEVET